MEENNKFDRLENESDNSYQTRLTVMKLVDGEDLDWADIKDLLLSEKHRDTIRKEGYGIQIASEYYEKLIAELQDEYYAKLKLVQRKTNEVVEDARLKELNNKINQLKKERQKIKDERNDINAQIRVVARVEHLVECMKDKIEQLNKTKPLLSTDKIVTTSDREGVVLLSDIHYGAETDNILDCYNPDICRKKLDYLYKKVVQYANENKLSTLYVLGLGDFISGLIHNTNRFDSRLLITEQVIEVAEVLAEFINNLSQDFFVKYAIVQGNHSRITAQKDDSREEENFTEFIRPFVKHRLKDNENVEYIEHKDGGIIEVEVAGYKCLGIHGDCDKDKGLNKLIDMFDYRVDYIFRGHFHQSKQFDVNLTTLYNNGAFGGEGYAKRSRLYNKPIQKFLVFERQGNVCCYDINLNNYNK